MLNLHGSTIFEPLSFLSARKCDHCDVNAKCLDGFRCACNEGYQGDGQDCQSTYVYR